MTEPPPVMEEEFNAGYDAERLAERLAITGFHWARRWVALCIELAWPEPTGLPSALSGALVRLYRAYGA